jgi:hypothetical protein
MHLLSLALSALSVAGSLGTDRMGPQLPPIKGLRPPLPLAASVADYTRASLRDLAGGAVVVVEDYLPLPMLMVPTGFSLIGGRLRFQTGGLGLGAFQGGVAVFPWMDSNAVRSGGNVVSRIYPIGTGY